MILPFPVGPARRALLLWYRRHARDLPWRRTRRVYRIWLSEIMLQQTQVKTATPYYLRFLRTFPTLRKLALAHEDQVLKLWEGLGYYSRGRNLLQAAKLLHRSRHYPHTAQGWQVLPGIGAYTAAAIASIAYGEPAAVLDGNVKRVLARLLALRQSVDDRVGVERLQQAAQALLDPRRPGDFNQAMMELGATLCSPRNPDCTACPLRTVCRAKERGLEGRLPLRRKRVTPPHHTVVAGVILKGERVLIGQRPGPGLLAGLWEFPGGKLEPGETLPQALVRELREELGIQVRVGKALIQVDHAYTHLSVTLHFYRCFLVKGVPRPLYHRRLVWEKVRNLTRRAFPKANLPMVRLLERASI